MATWIALLRGINVGGRNKLPMKSLVSLLEDLGPKEVKTYIQSGNVVFRHTASDSARLEARIGAAIAAQHGFRPEVLLVKGSDFERVVSANPFPAAADEQGGKALHAFFLGAQPQNVDRAALDAAKHPSESWKLVGKALYLHAPERFHGSKLAAKVERVLGVKTTARNWRTVSKLLELVRALD